MHNEFLLSFFDRFHDDLHDGASMNRVPQCEGDICWWVNCRYIENGDVELRIVS